MEVYAAQIDRMDQGIGRILAALEQTGQLDNTLVIFLADNGACAEDIPENVPVDELVNKLMIAKSHTRDGEPVHFGNDPDRMPGPENTYQSYGTAWANLSNTPFRLYKHWIHEGGISTPLIVHWPQGIADEGRDPAHARATCPTSWRPSSTSPARRYPQTVRRQAASSRWKARRCCRRSTRDGVERPPMFWEHEGNAAVRIGKWKLVRKYPGPVGAVRHGSRTAPRLHDLAAQHPERVADMARAVRRLGRALRRDPAREDRRADGEPGRDARVLGEEDA